MHFIILQTDIEVPNLLQKTEYSTPDAFYDYLGVQCCEKEQADTNTIHAPAQFVCTCVHVYIFARTDQMQAQVLDSMC